MWAERMSLTLEKGVGRLKEKAPLGKKHLSWVFENKGEFAVKSERV